MGVISCFFQYSLFWFIVFILFYNDLFKANNRSTIISEGTSNSTEIRIGNLTSSTDYALLIYVVTSNRVSNKFMEYFVSTSNNSGTFI